MLVVFSVLELIPSAFAASVPQAIGLSGQLFNPDGSPLTAAHVNFSVRILDAAETCALYSENHLGFDLGASEGRFTLTVGAGSAAVNNVDGSGHLSAAVFANSGIVSVANCAQPAVALSAGDGRQVRVSYDVGSGYVALTPDVPLVSSANAMIADSVQGKSAADFVQIVDNGTTVLNQANAQYTYSATNWPRLKSLLDGNSAQYLPSSPSAALSLNNQRVTNVADPSAPQDAATKHYADTTLAGQPVDVSAVTPMGGDGNVLQWDSAVDKWVAKPVMVTATGSAGGDLTGTYPNPTIANGAITANKINASGIGVSRILITDATNPQLVTFGTCAVNQVYAWTAGGWACTNVSTLAPVTSVNGKTGPVSLNAGDITGFGTSALYDWGTSANQIVRLDVSARLPAVDGSQLSNVNAVALQTRPVSAAAPTPGQVLGWNGSAWLPVASSGGSVTYVGGGAGLAGGPITSAGTLAVDVGTGANQIPQLNASAQLPAVDGSQLTNVNSTKLQSRAVASTMPNPAQVLGWNAVTTQWEPTSVAASMNTPLSGLTAAAAVNTIDNLNFAQNWNWSTATTQTPLGISANALTSGSLLSLQSSSPLLNSTAGLLNVVNSGASSNGLVARVQANSTAGSGLTVKADGSVGIGSAAPTGLFQVRSSTPSALNWVSIVNNVGGSLPPAAGGNGLSFGFNRSNSDGESNVVFGTNGATNPALTFATFDGTTYLEKMRLSSAGSLGIGTTAPASGLDIATTGTISSAVIVPRDTTANRPSAPVNGMLRYASDTGKLEAYQGGAWGSLTGGTASGVALSGITAAAAVNTIDNLNFAQMWNWSTATSQSPLSLGADALTSGSLLNLTSASANLSSTNGILNVANTGTSTSGVIAKIQANATPGSGLTVLANGNVGIGTPTPLYPLHVRVIRTDVSGTIPNASIYQDVQPTGSSSASNVGLSATARSASAQIINSLSGLQASAVYTGAGSVASLIGANPFAQNNGVGAPAAMAVSTYSQTSNNSTGGIVDAFGSRNEVGNYAGTITNAYGSRHWVIDNNTANITNGYGERTELVNQGSGTITNLYGLSIGMQNSGGGAVTNFTGVRVDDAGVNPNYFAFYAAGSTKSYFGGNVGIGTLTPAAILDITATGTGRSAMIVPRDTTGNRPTAPVNGMIRYASDLARLEAFQGGAWGPLSGGTASSLPLNGITAAAAVNTIDNLNFAQTWNWSTATTQTPLAISANALTTGSALSVSSSSPSLNSTAGLLNVINTGTSTSGLVARVQGNATAGSGLTVLASGNVGINSSAPFYALDVVGGGRFTAGLYGTSAYFNNFRAANGTAASPTYVFVLDGATGMYDDSSNGLGLSTLGTARFNITAVGNVGVGTTAPLSGLDVSLTGTGASAIIVPRDTVANRPSAPVNGMIRYASDTGKLEAYQGGTWGGLTGGTASSLALNGITAAAAVNTIDNLNFAQTWNWSTATTQTPLSVSANAMTTGSGLAITSSSPTLSSTNGLLTVANTGTSTSGLLARLQATGSAGSGLTVANTGNVSIGTTTSAYLLDVGTFGLTGALISRGKINELSTEKGVQIGYGPAGDSPRFWLGNGTTNWQIDNNGGAMRFFTPSNTVMQLAMPNTLALNGGEVIGAGYWSTFGPPANGLIVQGNVGVGTSVPGAALDVATVGTAASAIIVPRDTSGNRPSAPVNGMIRYASDLAKLEAYQGGAWGPLSGGTASSLPLNGITAAAAVNTIDSLNFAQTWNWSTATTQTPLTIGANALTTGSLLSLSSTSVSLNSSAGLLNVANTGTSTSGIVARVQSNSNAGSGLTVLANGNVGIGSAAPTARLLVPWMSGDVVSTAFFGSNNGSNNQIAVAGQSWTAIGVSGSSSTAAGVQGSSGSGTAVYGASNSGYAIAGRSGSGTSGWFQSGGTTNTAPTLQVVQAGTAPGDLQQWVDSGANVLMTVKPSGNIGVGTAAPLAALDVATTGSAASAIIVPRDTTGNRPSTPVNGMIRYNNSINAMEGYVNGGWSLFATGTAGSGSSQWTTTGSDIYYSTGKVGIGTNAPASALQVNASGAAPVISVGNLDTGGSGGAVNFTTNFTALANPSKIASSISGGPDSTSGGKIVFSTSQTSSGTLLERARIDAQGRMGIGTNVPLNVLHLDAAAQPGITITASGTEYATLGAATSDALYSTTAKAGDTVFRSKTGNLVLTALNGTGGIGFASGLGDTTKMYMTNAGSFGIGSALPQAALDVAVTGTAASAIIVPRDTSGNRPSTPVNGMIRYASDLAKLEAYQGGAWGPLSGGSASSLPLNGITAAAAVNTIDNLNFAQTWNWSSATTQTPLSMSANALTTGSMLSLSSSSSTLNSNLGLLSVVNPGTSTSGLLARMQSNSASGSGLTVLANGNVGVGTTAPGGLFNVFQVSGVTSGTTNVFLNNGTFSPSASSSANYNNGNFNLSIAGGQTLTGTVTGVSSTVGINSAGSQNNVYGVFTNAAQFNSPGTTTTLAGTYNLTQNNSNVTNGYGTFNEFRHGGGGTSTSAYGTFNKINNQSSGTIASGYGTYNAITNLANGTITNGYGEYIAAPVNSGGGTFTNFYGLYLETPTAAGTNYAIYSAGGTSYLGGRLGIGTTAPAAALDVATLGTAASAIIVPRDTSGNRPSAPVNGMIRYASDLAKLEAYQGGSWQTLSGGAASSVALNGITAAAAVNTIDNLNFAQTWNWSTATTQTPLSFNANALTTGSMLSLSSSNASLASTSGLLNVANTGASTTGLLARLQSNSSTGSGLSVLNNGFVGVGTSAPTAPLHVLLSGTAISGLSTGSGDAFVVQKDGAPGDQANAYLISGSGGSSSLIFGYVGAPRAASVTYAPSPGAMVFNNGGERMRLDSTGRLGIGTTAPLAALDVATTGTTASAIIVPRDTTGNRPSAPVNGMIRYASDLAKLEAYQGGAWSTLGSGGGGTALSGITAAAAVNTIDNLNFAQTWNWSTATTQTPLSINANAITTGTALSIASTNNTFNSTNGLLRVVNTGTSTSGMVARIQSNATSGSGLTVTASGNVGIGNANPSAALHINGQETITYTGGDPNIPLIVDASASTIDGSPAFQVIIPNVGQQKAFQLKNIGAGSGWASFEYNVGGPALPGLSLGVGGTRDTLLYRSGGNQFRTNASLIIDGSVGVGTTIPAAGLDVALTGAGSSAIIVPRDTVANRPSTPVNGMIRYASDLAKLEAYQNGAWQTLGGGGGTALSGITAAAAVNTIDNLNFAQTWNWSTATTQAPLAINANALTTGSLLSLTTTSPNLNTSGGLLNVANTGTATSGLVARIQANSVAGSGLSVLANGAVGIGLSTPDSALGVYGSDASTNGKGAAIALSNSAPGGANFWLRAGATNTMTPAGGFSIADAAAYRFVIDGGGKVGIGTILPAANFHVRASAGSTALTSFLDNVGTGASAHAISYLSSANGNAFQVFQTGTNWSVGVDRADGNKFKISQNGTPGPGNGDLMTVLTTGFVGIGTTTPGYALDVNGTIRGYGITDSSDLRLKRDVKPLVDSLARITALQGVSYVWLDPAKGLGPQIGLIAQQVEAVYPELVQVDGEGLRSLNYSHLVAPLIEAVKSLYAKLTSHDESLRELRAENARLKAAMDAQALDLARKTHALSKVESRLDALEKKAVR